MPELVKVTPDKELEFPPDMYTAHTVSVQITNMTDAHVAYKMKTTAPKSYLVKPSSGVVAPGPGTTVFVDIIMQPRVSPPDGSQDRFLLQAVKHSNTTALTKAEWDAVDKTELHDQKFVVKWTPSNKGSSPAALSEMPMATAISPNDLKSKYAAGQDRAQQLENDCKSLRKQVEELQSAGGAASGNSLVSLIVALLIGVVAGVVLSQVM
mmetsp:Transcript_5973/g.12957  ORF Transcript_5973/g.12957 Transcript_5973/m.12957 type:complete len:209 (+) Transcript_5973:66-692(+)